jgi:hypothetical protein
MTEGNTHDQHQEDRNMRAPANLDQTAADLKMRVKGATGPQEKLDAQCRLVLFRALEIGADIDVLTEDTGCPREVIQAISYRMRAASVWIGPIVNDLEWWNEDGSLSWAFSAHAQVAQGNYIRECNHAGDHRYVECGTGKIIGVWRSRDYIRAKLDPLEHAVTQLEFDLKRINMADDAEIESLIQRLDQELVELECSESAVFVDVRVGPGTRHLRLVYSNGDGLPQLKLGNIVSGRISDPYPLLDAPREEQIGALRALPTFIRNGIKILTAHYQLVQRDKYRILKDSSEALGEFTNHDGPKSVWGRTSFKWFFSGRFYLMLAESAINGPLSTLCSSSAALQ